MKFTEGVDGGLHRLELTRRNLQTLLDKLDDPLSKRTLVDRDWQITVIATEAIIVEAVEDAEHYSDRPPGTVYMPTKDEYRR